MWTLKCVLAQGPEKKKSSVHSFDHLKLNHVWLLFFKKFYLFIKIWNIFLVGYSDTCWQIQIAKMVKKSISKWLLPCMYVCLDCKTHQACLWNMLQNLISNSIIAIQKPQIKTYSWGVQVWHISFFFLFTHPSLNVHKRCLHITAFI